MLHTHKSDSVPSANIIQMIVPKINAPSPPPHQLQTTDDQRDQEYPLHQDLILFFSHFLLLLQDHTCIKGNSSTSTKGVQPTRMETYSKAKERSLI